MITEFLLRIYLPFLQIANRNLLCSMEMSFRLVQEVFYQTGIGGIIYSKYFMRAWCRVFLEQTVARQGSLVFCVSKSSAAERERLKSLERKERVCGECPTPCSSKWKVRVYEFFTDPKLFFDCLIRCIIVYSIV
jgi:hypothetical protein